MSARQTNRLGKVRDDAGTRHGGRRRVRMHRDIQSLKEGFITSAKLFAKGSRRNQTVRNKEIVRSKRLDRSNGQSEGKGNSKSSSETSIEHAFSMRVIDEVIPSKQEIKFSKS